MEDPIQAILAGCEELSESLTGLDVIDEDEIHLRISNPVLGLDLQHLGRKNINEVPKPPSLFRPETEILNQDVPIPIPWMSPTQKYLEQHLPRDDDFVVSFVDHGSFSTGTRAAQIEKQADRQAKERSDKLSDSGIPAEKQIVITLDGRVRESVMHRLSASYLAAEGWFVSTDYLYMPPGKRGAPDLIAWRSPLTEALQEIGATDGATVQELSYLRLLNNQRLQPTQLSSQDDTTETLVGEVKGSERSIGEANTQLLEKYVPWGYFDYGYSVVPGYRDRQNSDAGIITLDQDGFQMLPDAVGESDDGTRANTDAKSWFSNHMDKVACQALLCNLSFDELTELIPTGVNSPNELAHELWNLSPEIVVEEVLGE